MTLSTSLMDLEHEIYLEKKMYLSMHYFSYENKFHPKIRNVNNTKMFWQNHIHLQEDTKFDRITTQTKLCC
jgi:hypothetical protein